MHWLVTKSLIMIKGINFTTITCAGGDVITYISRHSYNCPTFILHNLYGIDAIVRLMMWPPLLVVNTLFTNQQ